MCFHGKYTTSNNFQILSLYNQVFMIRVAEFLNESLDFTRTLNIKNPLNYWKNYFAKCTFDRTLKKPHKYGEKSLENSEKQLF